MCDHSFENNETSVDSKIQITSNINAHEAPKVNCAEHVKSINEIYDKVTNNKILLNNSQCAGSRYTAKNILPFEQGNDLFIKPEIKEESNYIFNLLNTLRILPSTQQSINSHCTGSSVSFSSRQKSRYTAKNNKVSSQIKTFISIPNLSKNNNTPEAGYAGASSARLWNNNTPEAGYAGASSARLWNNNIDNYENVNSKWDKQKQEIVQSDTYFNEQIVHQDTLKPLMRQGTKPTARQGTLLNHLSNYLGKDNSNIKNNIEKHINDDDIESLKNFSHSYKKSIQSIKKFLIDENTDNNITNDLLYYISYLYNISFLIINNNIYNLISSTSNNLHSETSTSTTHLQNNNTFEILIFQKHLYLTQHNQISITYNILESIKYSNLDNYLKTYKLIKYKSNSELNKLKISEIKDLCNLLNIDNNKIKNLLIADLNLEFNKF
jgi:hypothetical protein